MTESSATLPSKSDLTVFTEKVRVLGGELRSQNPIVSIRSLINRGEFSICLNGETSQPSVDGFWSIQEGATEEFLRMCEASSCGIRKVLGMDDELRFFVAKNLEVQIVPSDPYSTFEIVVLRSNYKGTRHASRLM